jgi:hypothetical protein
LVVKSKKAVYAALLGNLGIAIAKLLAHFIRKCHVGGNLSFFFRYNESSFAINWDKECSRPASERHSFGYGKEQFLVISCVHNDLWYIWVLSLQQGLEAYWGSLT